jgi:hypothetical protein
MLFPIELTDNLLSKAVAFLSKELSARPKHGLNLPNSDISGLSIDRIVA